MSLEATLTAILKSVSPRVFADFAPTTTQRPYITFQQIGGEVIQTLANEVASKENADMQISVWADSRTAAKTAIKQIEAAIVASPEFVARQQGAAVSDYDADMERYCSRQDFSIWADR
jgi:hypothetical protein